MRTGVITSVIIHTALIVIALVGLGTAKPLEPEVVESIAVDLVPITDVTNIRAGSLDSKIVETETPAVAESDKPAELAQKTGNTTEDQVTPQETDKATPAPVVNTAPEPTPEEPTPPDPAPAPEAAPPPEPTPPPAPEPDPAPAEPEQQVATDTATDAPAAPVAPMPAMRPAQLQKAPAKPETPTKVAEVKPKPAETKPVEKPKASTSTDTSKTATKPAAKPSKPNAKPADQVADLINSETSRGATTGQGGTPTLGKNTGRAATLTQSQLDGLVAQIKTCMNVPAGAAEAGITAQLHFMLDASGNVQGMPDIVAADPSQLGRALASAAQRAVMRCGPYTMAPGQEVQATFDPRELT